MTTLGGSTLGDSWGRVDRGQNDPVLEGLTGCSDAPTEDDQPELRKPWRRQDPPPRGGPGVFWHTTRAAPASPPGARGAVAVRDTAPATAPAMNVRMGLWKLRRSSGTVMSPEGRPSRVVGLARPPPHLPGPAHLSGTPPHPGGFRPTSVHAKMRGLFCRGEAAGTVPILRRAVPTFKGEKTNKK